MINAVKYPSITIRLGDYDSSTDVIVGRVVQALKRNSVPVQQVRQFEQAVDSCDYDTALDVAGQWVNIT